MWPLHRNARAALAYAAAATISAAAAVPLLGLGGADLRVPFSYSGDALLYSLITKSTLDHGWFWTNPNVGAPGGLELYDFPTAAHDAVHLLIIKLMSVFSSDWALLFNVYFLLGFPLITLSAMAVFRHFRIGYAPALVAAILYSYLPSRLLKGEGHPFLDVFYQVPLAVLVLLWVCGDDPPLTRQNDSGRWPRVDLGRARSWGSLVVAAFVSSTSLYYAFFSALLLVACGIWASAVRRSLGNAIAGIVLAGTIGLGLIANGLPSILYWIHHGPSPQIANRKPWEAEVFGMRIVQLLLPVSGHRVPALAELKRYYDATAPLMGESGATSLGLVGDAGFLVLLGVLLLGRRTESPERRLLWSLSVLNLMAVLLGTIGGFGSLFALLISPQIRTYARLNVFIGFFALFAVAVLFDRLARRSGRLALGMLVIVLVVGLLDQASPAAIRDYGWAKREYTNDEDLVRRIEAALPPNSAVFELPYQSFPDSPAVHRTYIYDPVRPYLHSRQLRWSYPAMVGRPGDSWAREMSQRTPDRMVGPLTQLGFAGILVDRDGYADGGCGIEAAFRMALATPPLSSRNRRYLFFSLAECAEGACDACGTTGRPCCAAGPKCRAGDICHAGECTCGKLDARENLASGETMASCDSRFSLSVRGDGDVVLSGCGCKGEGGSCWSTGSVGVAGAELVMQGDGNLALVGPTCTGLHNSCWATNTVGHPGAWLALQNDGNLCIYGAGCTGANGTCWCTGTVQP